METVVLSLGGSLVNPGKPDKDYCESLASILLKMPFRFGIVVGGGKLAREWADEVRKRGGNEFEADEAAIRATRINAHTMIESIRRHDERAHVYPHVIEQFSDARREAQAHSIVIMGGTIPGITTDADSVLLAECLRSRRVVNLSNIDGIYSGDPKKDSKAKKFKKMPYGELIELSSRSDSRRAGTNFVFDSLACKLIARSNIETHFVNGKKLGDVKSAIEGKAHSGTVVK